MKKFEYSKILGLRETVIFQNQKYIAKIDTGAETSSMDEFIFNSLKSQLPKEQKKIIEICTIKSSLGISKRKKVKLKITLKNQEFIELFTIADRSHLSCQILIGCNILKKGNFVVFPNLKKT